MDAKYYCDGMQSELTFLKARVYDIMRAIEKMPAATRNKLSGQYSELHGLIDHLTDRIDQLKKECPMDWSDAKAEIETTKQKLLDKINYWDSEHIAGGYVGG
ncbi:MAG: hypothetical protein ACLFUU_10945 [Desulfobacteraceae bacterium]